MNRLDFFSSLCEDKFKLRAFRDYCRDKADAQSKLINDMVLAVDSVSIEDTPARKVRATTIDVTNLPNDIPILTLEDLPPELQQIFAEESDKINEVIPLAQGYTTRGLLMLHQFTATTNDLADQAEDTAMALYDGAGHIMRDVKITSREVCNQANDSLHAAVTLSASAAAMLEDDIASRITIFNDSVQQTFSNVYTDTSNTANYYKDLLSEVKSPAQYFQSLVKVLGVEEIGDSDIVFPGKTDISAFTGATPVPSLALGTVLDKAKTVCRLAVKAVAGVFKAIFSGVRWLIGKAKKFVRETFVDPYDVKDVSGDVASLTNAYAQNSDVPGHYSNMVWASHLGWPSTGRDWSVPRIQALENQIRQWLEPYVGKAITYRTYFGDCIFRITKIGLATMAAGESVRILYDFDCVLRPYAVNWELVYRALYDCSSRMIAANGSDGPGITLDSNLQRHCNYAGKPPYETAIEGSHYSWFSLTAGQCEQFVQKLQSLTLQPDFYSTAGKRSETDLYWDLWTGMSMLQAIASSLVAPTVDGSRPDPTAPLIDGTLELLVPVWQYARKYRGGWLDNEGTGYLVPGSVLSANVAVNGSGRFVMNPDADMPSNITTRPTTTDQGKHLAIGTVGRPKMCLTAMAAHLTDFSENPILCDSKFVDGTPADGQSKQQDLWGDGLTWYLPDVVDLYWYGDLQGRNKSDGAPAILSLKPPKSGHTVFRIWIESQGRYGYVSREQVKVILPNSTGSDYMPSKFLLPSSDGTEKVASSPLYDAVWGVVLAPASYDRTEYPREDVPTIFEQGGEQYYNKYCYIASNLPPVQMPSHPTDWRTTIYSIDEIKITWFASVDNAINNTDFLALGCGEIKLGALLAADRPFSTTKLTSATDAAWNLGSGSKAGTATDCMRCLLIAFLINRYQRYASPTDYPFLPYRIEKESLPEGKLTIKSDDENVRKADVVLNAAIITVVVVVLSVVIGVTVKKLQRASLQKHLQRKSVLDNKMWQGESLTKKELRQYKKSTKKLNRVGWLSGDLQSSPQSESKNTSDAEALSSGVMDAQTNSAKAVQDVADLSAIVESQGVIIQQLDSELSKLKDRVG